MTRIIAGMAGGRRLQTPAGETTRPTSDRVREAVFSSVEALLGTLRGMAVLDAYAGSGALGLEALSRGAARVTFVEQDRSAASVILGNATQLRAGPGPWGDVEVVNGTVDAFLGGTTSQAWRDPGEAPSQHYDLVLLDPPYAVDADQLAGDLEALKDWLAADALVIVERPSKRGAFEWPRGYEPRKVRKYGETSVHSAWFAALGC